METIEVPSPSLAGSVGLVAEPEAPMEVRQLSHRVCEVVRTDRCGLAGESKLEFDVVGWECRSITQHRNSLSPDEPLVSDLGPRLSNE
ncbi:MAG: hypothetical protein JO291_03230 [Acidimicrobiia bacterium]|nr:hypothetical protein [Acidimicrobiia bacterium]